jgi:L-lactate dehydrogenase complex protein LldG
VNARDEVLARVRHALGRSASLPRDAVPANGPEAARAAGSAETAGAAGSAETADAAGSAEAAGTAGIEVPREYRTAGQHPPGSAPLLDLLTERLRDYHAEVHHCGGPEIEGTVTALLDRRGMQDLVLPPQPPVDLDSWTGRRHRDGDPGGAQLTSAELDAADGVLTGCAVAVAETGTIVLDGSPACGRRAVTLVPDYHLVVVKAGQVVQTVPEAVARLEPTRPLTWISGPSATSDIELDRVEGVHGPRTLVVVLVTA